MPFMGKSCPSSDWNTDVIIEAGIATLDPESMAEKPH
jgi:hypothetical protein